MIPTLTARLSALHVSSNVARTRLTLTATRSVFVAVRSRPTFQVQARTFLNSAAAESPAKKSTSSESSEDKPKKTATKKATTTKAKPRKAAAKKTTPKPKKVVVKKAPKPVLPKLPRWPPNNYIYWYTTTFLPNWTGDLKNRGAVTAVAKEAGEVWKNITEAEKLRIQEEITVKREEAKKAREAFLADLPLDTFNAINRARAAKGKNRVPTPPSLRRPKNAYVQFVVEYMGKERNGRDVREVMKEAAEKWQTLSEAEKKPYVEAFERECAEWQARHPEATSTIGKA